MAGGKQLKLAISIGGKIDKSLGSAINNAQSQLDKIGNISNKIGKAATAAVVAGTTKIVNDSIKTYATYESALNSAAATAGVEKDTAAYEAMDAAARKAGATTVKTAKESAEALEYMALAGWSVDDGTKALTPILKLSAASGMELATTSDLVTDSMAAMGLGINDLGRYLDVLAKGNNSANYKTQQLLESYIGVGGVLRNLNVPIEKSAAVLGVMANQGLKSSEAGTALNAILMNMQKKSGDSYKAMTRLGVSMYDSKGKARDLLKVFQDVHDKTAGMTEQQRNLMYQMIGGKSHVADFAMIMNGFAKSTETGTAQVYDLEKAYNGAQGTLDKFYDIKTDTLEGNITRLNSAYEGMLLNIGERLAPTASNAVGNLVEKIPQIENTVVSFLEEAIPLSSKIIDITTRNPDKIIKSVTGIAKAFIAFKALKGVTQIVTLAKDIHTLTKAAGGLSVLKGAAGAITGIGTGAAAAAGAAMPLAGLLLATGAAAHYLYGRLDAAESYKWVDKMSAAAEQVQNTSEKLASMSKIQNEIAGLKMVINSDDATSEQIETARSQLGEIAEMLERDYGLNINIDSKNLDDTAEKVSRIVSGINAAARADFINSVNKSIGAIESTYSDYESTLRNLPQQEAELDSLNAKAEKYSELWGNISAAMKNHSIGLKDGKAYSAEQYLSDMKSYQNQLMQFYKTYGIAPDSYTDMNFSADAGAATMWGEEFMRAGNQYSAQAKAMGENVTAAMQKIQEYEGKVNEVTNQIANTLANNVLLGDNAGIQATEGIFSSYIERLKTLGVETDTVIGKFALAKQGFTDVAEATAAGDTAIQSVISNMAKIGEKNNLFINLDTSGISDKLTNMAHAIGLIPEDKMISINAEGNIEVLDRAQQAIMTIDKKNAKVNVSGSVTGMDKIQQAVDNKDKLENVSVEQVATGSFPGMRYIWQALQYQSQLDDRTVTYKVIYKQEGTQPGQNASGTPSWRGGFTWLNDQPGISDPREVVEYKGQRYWFGGRNVLADVPKGARIYSAAESRSLLSDSDAEEYRTGSGMFGRAAERLRYTRSESGADSGGLGGSMTVAYSPNIVIEGNADEAAITRALRDSYDEFKEFMERYEREKRRKSFDFA